MPFQTCACSTQLGIVYVRVRHLHAHMQPSGVMPRKFKDSSTCVKEAIVFLVQLHANLYEAVLCTRLHIDCGTGSEHQTSNCWQKGYIQEYLCYIVFSQITVKHKLC